MTQILVLIISFLTLLYFPTFYFDINLGMGIPTLYIKKIDIPQKSFLNHTHYAQSTKKFIQGKKDSDLIGIRCTDGIVRTFQGIYLLENLKAENGEKKRVKNADFVNFMRAHEPLLSKNKRILVSRVCELENKSLLVFYAAGTYNTREADFLSPRQNVLNSDNNIAFVEFFPSKISLFKKSVISLAKSDDHARCDKLFLIDKNGNALILCEEKLDFASVFTTISFNLYSGKIKQIEKCRNNYSVGLITSCE